MPIPLKMLVTCGMGGGMLAAMVGAAVVHENEAAWQRRLRGHGILARVALDPWSGSIQLLDVDAVRSGKHYRAGRIAFLSGSSLAALLRPVLTTVVSPALASPVEDALHVVIEGLEKETKSSATAPKAAAPASGSPAGMAVATDVSFTDGTTTYRVGRVELAGSAMSSDDLLALLDPKSAAPFEARLRQVSARAVTVTDLSFAETGGPRPHKATVKQILLADVVKGRAAVGSVGGFADLDDGKTVADLQIGGAQLAGVDFGQLAHILTATRTDPNEPLQPIADSLALNAITSNNTTTGVAIGTIASIKEHGLRARPLGATTPVAAPAAGNPARDEGDGKGSKVDGIALLRDFATSVSVDEIVLEGLVPAPSTKDADKASLLAIGSLTLRDIAQGTFGTIDLKSFRFDDPQTRLSLDAASLRKLSFAGKPAGAAKPTDASKPTVPKPTDAAVSVVPSLDALDVTNLAMTVDTADKGSPPAPTTFKIAHVAYAASGAEVGALPAHSTVALEHILVDLPPESSSAAPLRSLGYKQLDITATMATSYDQSAQRFTLDKLTASEPEMGSLDLSLDLTNVAQTVVSPNPAIAKASALAILVQGVALKLRNTSLVDRILAQRAEHDGKTVQQERDLYAGFVTEQAPQIIGDLPQLRPLEQAVAAFIREPRTLEVAITSANGLGLADSALLNDPNALLDKLTISAKANQ